jgi:DNA-directed RNA polymerase subunit N (RpoN/RPB10)
MSEEVLWEAIQQPLVCLHCNTSLNEEWDINHAYECAHCGAVYVFDFEGYDAQCRLEEHLKTPFDDLDILSKFVDVLTDEPEQVLEFGDRVYLYCAKKKTAQ